MAAGAIAAATALACTATWDAEGWARAHPELTGRPLGRLGDATPYLIAADDALHLFLCRWPLDGPLAVALPSDASPAERALLARALAAWEDAVPGLRFAPGARGQDAPLRLRFAAGEREGARTSATCRVRAPLAGAGPLDAALVAAEVALRRSEGDAWGRSVPLSDAELLGSAVHELGHALGLQGHARRGPSVLVREPAAVRRVGERLLAGGVLREDAAAALHALPSGTRVGRRALAPGATAGVDALARRARARGREVLWLQLGDRALRVAWGSEPELVYYLSDPAQLASGSSDFSESLWLPAAPVGAGQPTSGSSSRAFASRFAAGAGSPSDFSTSDRW